MKNILVIGIVFCAMSAFASDKGNGGDICENRIRNISLDLESWLIRGEYNGINLPEKLSEENYKNGMLEAVKNSIVSCTTEKVFVGKSEKTCKNFIDEESQTRIQCNFDRFMKTDGKEQYRLIHHEFAGVAGFEVNNGDEASKYGISNQISEFLNEEVVYTLGVKSQAVTKDFYLDQLPEGSIVEFTKSLKFGIGETFIFGSQDEYGRGISVEFKKNAKLERIVKPRSCQLKKVKRPFANLLNPYKIILKGDAVCESLVVNYFALGPAKYFETASAAKNLGISITLPRVQEN